MEALKKAQKYVEKFEKYVEKGESTRRLVNHLRKQKDIGKAIVCGRRNSSRNPPTSINLILPLLSILVLILLVYYFIE